MNMLTAGIDVGGTKTLLCLTDEEGTVLEQYKVETQLSREPEVFFRWLFAELEQFCKRNGTTLTSLKGVGIGFPGVMNERTGTLTSAPALNWPATTDIRPVIAAYYPGLVVLDNDVNMAAMGEYAAGSAAGSEHFIMITVGTGVGSALFLNGQLYREPASLRVRSAISSLSRERFMLLPIRSTVSSVLLRWRYPARGLSEGGCKAAREQQ